MSNPECPTCGIPMVRGEGGFYCVKCALKKHLSRACLLLSLLLLVGCGIRRLPMVPDYASGFTDTGHSWSYERIGYSAKYQAFASEGDGDALHEVLIRLYCDELQCDVEEIDHENYVIFRRG